MNTTHSNEARKRAVNLSLSEDLVVQARGLTSNLSGIVESLLADYVEQDRQRRLAQAEKRAKTLREATGSPKQTRRRQPSICGMDSTPNTARSPTSIHHCSTAT